MDVIRFEGVSKYYHQVPVVQNINLTIKAGETLVLLGPSGCGKTTLLKLINGLILPDKGSILFKGEPVGLKDVISLRRKIGYVIQEVGLFPHLTIAENLLMPSKIKGDKIDSETVDKWLRRLGLDRAIRNRLPDELSGGQQQRIGIARALITNPELILLDEPFSALDNITRGQLQDDFIKLESLVEKTSVLVTHDVQEAFKLGDRIVLLDKGVIQQVGKPLDLLMNPANALVSTFLAQDRLLLELEHIRFEKNKRALSLLEVLQDPNQSSEEKMNVFNQFITLKHKA